MFVQQKNNAIYRVSLSLDKVLRPFWDLTRNLLGEALLTNRDYSDYDLDFQQEKTDRIKRAMMVFQKRVETINKSDVTPEEKQKWLADEEKVKLDTVYLDAFNCIHKYYLNKALSSDCFKKINSSCSLIIYKEYQEECWFVTEDGLNGKFDKEFKDCLASIHVVDDFIKFLNGGIEDNNGYNPKIYANVFPYAFADNAVSIASPIYFIENIAIKEGTLRELSDFKIWFNTKHLKSLGYDAPLDGDVFEYRVGDTLVALEKGQYIIPMVTEWQSFFNITNEALILWTDYKNKIYNKKEKDDEKKQKPAKNDLTPAERDFVNAAMASEGFTNLLSYLTDNLYLTDDAPVPDAYKKFFDFVLKVEDLKHLADYKLYVPKSEEGTVLGVYKIHKLAGETEYNLRHMLYSERNGDTSIYKDYNKEERNVNSVQVLKPQYASFYMMDYYEFFVEEVLKALKELGVIKDYLRNQRYVYKDKGNNKGIEVDALVYNGHKIFLLELKTTLHIEFLNTYPHKYSALLSNEVKPDVYGFYLISSYADENLAVLKKNAKDGYNIRRNGLKSIPYKFDVAIPVKEDAPKKDLHCLSESSFNRLKAELERVFTA